MLLQHKKANHVLQNKIKILRNEQNIQQRISTVLIK